MKIKKILISLLMLIGFYLFGFGLILLNDTLFTLGILTILSSLILASVIK